MRFGIVLSWIFFFFIGMLMNREYFKSQQSSCIVEQQGPLSATENQKNMIKIFNKVPGGVNFSIYNNCQLIYSGGSRE